MSVKIFSNFKFIIVFTEFKVQSKLSVGIFCKKLIPVPSKLAYRYMLSANEFFITDTYVIYSYLHVHAYSRERITLKQ